MNFRPREFYTKAVPKKVVEATPIRVYFKEEGKLACVSAAGAYDHEDAILFVKEAINNSGHAWNEPVLAVIEGGKK